MRPKLDRSAALARRAAPLVPSLSQTFSKSPSQFVRGAAPVFLERGRGARVWDVDGNEYIDWAMGLAPVILGHAEPAVNDAVKAQIDRGTAFTLPHPLELEVAERLVERVPCAEMVRFGKNGSDATTAAVRAARAYTGRDVVACCGYHGWHDWFIGTTTRARGVPAAVRELTHTFDYNDLAGLEKILENHPGRVAAVILEPTGVIDPLPGFLEGIRDRCRREGVVLIYDEVVTGFRMAPGGAQEYYGVCPDLCALGKGMANGFALSAVAGKREIMEVFDEIFFSSTFGGETAGLAAARATLDFLAEHDVVAHLWTQGAALLEGLRERILRRGAEGLVRCVGHPPRHVMQFQGPEGIDPLVAKSFFQQECMVRGVLFTGGHNLCYRHGPREIEQTLRVYDEVLGLFVEAAGDGTLADRLVGPPIQPVFRKP